MGRGGVMLTPNELIFTFGFFICVSFGENRSRNATMRVHIRWKDRCTDTNQFYNLSHAICYSYVQITT